MKAWMVIMAGLVASPAAAAPMTLLCTGTFTIPPHGASQFSSETAILDLEGRTVKPPNWPVMLITNVTETDVFFGYHTKTASTVGNLDRISGSLTFNSMKPEEREKIAKGASAQFTAWMSAKCVPAQKMF